MYEISEETLIFIKRISINIKLMELLKKKLNPEVNTNKVNFFKIIPI